MAHKGKRGRERGGGGSSSSCPSSPATTRLDPRPQPELELTFHPPSSPSTMPCPPGSLLDSIHSSQTPAQVSPHQTSDESSSDAEQQPPTKMFRQGEAGSPMSSKRHRAKATSTEVLHDVTEIAVTGKGRTHGRHARSAFSFSPVRPPAAYSVSPWAPGRPADAPPSSALSRQWKMNALQRHVDSFAFYSRDRIETPYELPDSLATDDLLQYAMRIDTFEKTGALLWFQVRCLEGDRDPDEGWFSEGCTFSHTIIDCSGRRRGNERLLNSAGPCESDELPHFNDGDDTVNAPQHHLEHSHLGLSLNPHETLSSSPLYDVILFDFDEEPARPRPRGLARIQFVEPEDRDVACSALGGWLVYDMPNGQSTLSVPVQPLKAGDPCSEILEVYESDGGNEARKDELSLTLTISDNDDGTWSFSEMRLAPLDIAFLTVPQPEEHCFSAIAVNEGTGYCWLGNEDGTIEFLDALEWIEFNHLSCPSIEDPSLDHDSFCTCCVDEIQPLVVLPGDDRNGRRGSVTNIAAVGQREAVVAFADGSMVMMQKGEDRWVRKVRNYSGHVNDGTGATVELAVHTPSRLMAARGTDGQVRIWHLDHRFPLNTSWHRPRTSQHVALDLGRPKPSAAERILARAIAATAGSPTSASGAQQNGEAKPESSGAAPAASYERPSDEATAQAPAATVIASAAQHDDTWDRLATQGVEEADFAPIKKTRLADVRTKPFCGMAWTHTSWMADRDGQWEMTKDFDAAGRPKVVSAGLLPSLVCCSDRPRGTTFLYFEPAKRAGVEDAKLVELEDEEREEEGDAPIVY